jgi:hypothetical protein
VVQILTGDSEGATVETMATEETEIEATEARGDTTAIQIFEENNISLRKATGSVPTQNAETKTSPGEPSATDAKPPNQKT